MRINNRRRTFACFRLFAVGHCPHTSTLACGHLSTFSTFVHSRLFVRKHWLHINNTSHCLFSYSSDYLLAHIVHSSIIENVGHKNHSTPWKRKMYTFKATYNDHPSENNSIVLVSNGERLKTLRKQQNCKITKSCFHQVKSSLNWTTALSDISSPSIHGYWFFSWEDVGWKEKAWSTLVCLL